MVTVGQREQKDWFEREGETERDREREWAGFSERERKWSGYSETERENGPLIDGHFLNVQFKLVSWFGCTKHKQVCSTVYTWRRMYRTAVNASVFY